MIKAFQKASEKPSELFLENSILSKLFQVSKQLFNKQELNNLAHSVFKIEDCQLFFGESSLNRREVLSSDFSQRFFRFILDVRWKIVKEMSKVKEDDKLMTEDNLFTNFVDVTLMQTRSNESDQHILEIFKWIHDKFESKEVICHCVKRYFIASIKKLKLSQTAKEILKVVKSHLSDEEFTNLLQNGENVFDQTSSFRNDNLTLTIRIFSEIFTKTELKSIILNNNTVFGSNMLINVMVAHDCPSAVQSTLLEVVLEKFSEIEAFEIFKGTIHDGTLLIGFLSRDANKDKFQLFLNFINKNFTVEHQKELLLKHALKLCVMRESHTLDKLLESIKKVFNKNDLEELQVLVENEEQEPSSVNRNRKCFEALKTIALKSLSNEEFEDYVESCKLIPLIQ